MKKIVLFFAFSLFNLCNAQTREIDSLKMALKSSPDDPAKCLIFIDLGRDLRKIDIDNATVYAEQARSLALKLKNDKYLALSLTDIYMIYHKAANDQKALALAFDVLKLYEKISDSLGLAITWDHIGTIYDDLGEFDLSLAYGKEAYCIFEKEKDRANYHDRLYNETNIGIESALLNMPDTALPYLQEAFALHNANRSKWDIDSAEYTITLYGLGKVNFELGNLSIARPYYEKGLAYSKKFRDPWYSSINYMGLGELYKTEGTRDSAILYYNNALNTMNEKKLVLTIYNDLADLYQTTDPTLAFHYLKQELQLRDSLFTAKNKTEVENFNINEAERQKDLAVNKQQEKEERRQNMEYALIALGIVTFVILFLLVSQSIIVNEKWISFLGVLGLLVVFEFFNLLLHPSLASITNNSPFLMLLILVVLASVLIPMHHRMEKWIKEKMIEKNKKIRLAAAKKTIKKLEGEKPI